MPFFRADFRGWVFRPWRKLALVVPTPPGSRPGYPSDSSLRQQLNAQNTSLAQERSRSQELAGRVAQLQQRSQALNAEVQRLSGMRATLATLSANINNCLHAVDAALSSSTTIASMSSMRNVVTGIKGVVGGLGSEGMFAGPLAQLNKAAFGVLDHRVTSIRHLRLAF